LNPDLLKSTWTEAQSFGDDLILHFYTALFLAHPKLRDLFPDNMTDQRDHIHAMLNMVVRADNLEAVVPRLQRLGRDHRGYGAVAEHFPIVKDTLLATLEHYLGDAWTPEVAATWAEAIGVVANVMTRAAADASAAKEPLGWTATIYRTERFDSDVTLAVAVADFDCRLGDTIPLSIPEVPGTRRMATCGGWAAEGSLILLALPVTDEDPTSLQIAHLEPGEQIHLGAPIDLLIEGDPHA
jgi:hemoglobin-like flavoprotein